MIREAPSDPITELTPQEVERRTKEVIVKLNDIAFREGWAKGYEKGFAAGVEAMRDANPKVALTDA